MVTRRTPKLVKRDDDADVRTMLLKAASEIKLRPDLAAVGQGLLECILEKALEDKAAPSANGSVTGRVRRPFNFRATAQMKLHNEQHSTCIETKKAATVGLGHKNEKVAEVLDPLCRVSLLHTELQVEEDFENLGNGFLEVVREDYKQTGKIIGLHWQPAVEVDIEVENQNYEYHFVAGGPQTEQRFAAYGDLDSYRARRKIPADTRVTELIHFSQPSSFSRWWGVPFWLAAVASIELVQALEQHQFSFHQNRGVPEFILFLTGAKVKKSDWDLIQSALASGQGAKNAFKSLAINIQDPNLEIDLQKLALENAADGEFFAKIMEVLSLHIVSAHRVPPSLAGILIPGKMGAANEMSNAIIAFQSLLIKQQQENFATTLWRTLGQDPSLGLSEPKIFQFRTIVEEMAESMEALKPADTMGRMRDELPQAAAEGRDLEEGLKKAGEGPQREVLERAATKVLTELFRRGK